MEGTEDIDTCRICSAPAEATSPLFYPCKCSGTIKYIHQDCLKTWLEHSKKKKCDVCNHPYGFTKIYSPDMPEAIPSYLYIRRMLVQALKGLAITLRALLVAFVWLFVVPYATVISWRLYFYLGDRISWWVVDRPRPPQQQPFSPTKVSFTNLSRALDHYHSSSNSSLPSPELLDTFITALSSDIFQGQMIASWIFMVFIGLFILREYVAQNARPGMFGEGAPPPPPPPQPVPAPPAPLPQEQEGVVHPNIPLRKERDGEDEEELSDTSLFGSDDEHPPPLEPPPPLEEIPEEDVLRGQKRQKLSTSISPLAIAVKSEDGSPDGSSSSSSWFNVPGGSGSRGVEEDAMKKEEPEVVWATGEKGKSTLKRRRFDSPPPPEAPSLTVDRPEPSTSPSPSASVSTSRSSPTPSTIFPPPPPRLSSSSSSITTATTIDRSNFDFTFRPPRPPPPPPPPLIFPRRRDSLKAISSPKEQEKFRSLFPPMSDDSDNDDEATTTTKAYALARPPLLPDRDDLPLPSSSYRAPEELEESYFEDYDDDGREEELPGLEEVEPSSSSEEEVGDLPSSLNDPAYPNVESYVGRPPLSSPATTTASDLDEDEEDEEEEEYEEEIEIRIPHGRAHAAAGGGGAGGIGVPSDSEDDDGSEGDEEDVVVPAPPPPGGIAVGAGGGVRLVVPPAPQLGGGGGGGADGEEEDDMEALQGAIGMRGPVHVIIQHAALVIILLDLAIVVIVAVPYTLGKTVTLLSLDPLRTAQVLNAPVLVVRLVTDPFVDALMVIGARAMEKLGGYVPEVVKGLFEATNTEQHTSIFSSITTWMTGVLDWIHHFIITSPTLQPLVSVAQTLGNIYVAQAYGDSVRDRILVTLYGHGFLLLISVLYLYGTSKPNERLTGVKAGVKQLVILVKVAFFMIIELILFPLLCGVVLDFATLKFFGGATVGSRLNYLFYAPVTVAFCHWLAGTVYMYHFAITLSTCRTIMRPGAMWFIKDPQDPTFQPIREILDRQTVQQLKKLALSAFMYTLFILIGFLGTTFVLSYISFAGNVILPLRWNLRRPLSTIPIDLLFMHIIAPVILKHARPRRLARRLLRKWWRFSAQHLRLSSYMFDGDYPDEQFTYSFWRRDDEDDGKFEGSYRRVPKRDTIALVRNKPTLVETDKNGTPLTPEGAERMKLQDAECLKAKRKIEDDYQVIYVPPHFRIRLWTFCIGLCGVGILCAVTVIAFPLALGRRVFQLMGSGEVHDGYSFMIGCSLFWCCFLGGKMIDQAVKKRELRMVQRQRRSDRHRGQQQPQHDDEEEEIEEEEDVRPDKKLAGILLFLFKRFFRWFGCASWLLFWFGFAIPILMALVGELYLILPLRFILTPDFLPHVNILHMWALGVVYLKLFVRIMRHRDHTDTDIVMGIEKVRQASWTNPKAMMLTTDVIGPFAGGLLLVILFPPILFFPIQRTTTHFFPDALISDDKSLFRYVYPLLFVAALASQAIDSFRKILGSWSQLIRDKEFLLEMRLKNLDQDRNKSLEGSEEKNETTVVETLEVDGEGAGEEE